MIDKELVQSIIEKNGCWHVNCTGGSYVVHKIGKSIMVEDPSKYSNLGVPCPLRDQCFNDTEEKDILLMAKIYMKKLKKEKKNEEKNRVCE
jgi:hypothetical protein